MRRHVLWVATFIFVASLILNMIADMRFEDGSPDNEGWDNLASFSLVVWIVVVSLAWFGRGDES